MAHDNISSRKLLPQDVLVSLGLHKKLDCSSARNVIRSCSPWNPWQPVVYGVSLVSGTWKHGYVRSQTMARATDRWYYLAKCVRLARIRTRNWGRVACTGNFFDLGSLLQTRPASNWVAICGSISCKPRQAGRHGYDKITFHVDTKHSDCSCGFFAYCYQYYLLPGYWQYYLLLITLPQSVTDTLWDYRYHY